MERDIRERAIKNKVHTGADRAEHDVLITILQWTGSRSRNESLSESDSHSVLIHNITTYVV